MKNHVHHIKDTNHPMPQNNTVSRQPSQKTSLNFEKSSHNRGVNKEMSAKYNKVC